MRFSYIDSQGREIEVDSLESLALRIEVGAIGPDTRMYDAVADRWAPASKHPVFQALSRGEEVMEGEVEAIGVREGGEGEGEGDEDEEVPAGATEDGEGSPTPERSGDDPLGLDFSVTLAEGDEPREPVRGEEDPAPEPEGGDAGENDADEWDEGVAFAADAWSPEVEASGGEQEEEQGEEEEEQGEEEGEEGEDEGRSRDLPPWAGAEEAALWGEETGSERPPGWPVGDDPWHDEDDGVGGREGARAFGKEELPGWARPEEGDGGEREVRARAPGLPSRSADQVDAGEGEEGTAGSEPRSLAAEPGGGDHERSRDGRETGLRIGGALVVALVVAGGIGYVLFGGEHTPGGEGPRRADGVPVLVPELEARKEAAQRAAYEAALHQMRLELDRLNLPPGPPEAWLRGRYLSSASDFPQVARYWEEVHWGVESARRTLERRYRARLSRELEDRGGVPSSSRGGEPERLEASARVARTAHAEWERSAPDRALVFTRVLEVARASLDLHRLLAEREEEITYEPYRSPRVSRDPVLEAVAEDPELQERMNEGLDRVLRAVAESGIPRPISTSGIFEHLVELLRARPPW